MDLVKNGKLTSFYFKLLQNVNTKIDSKIKDVSSKIIAEFEAKKREILKLAIIQVEFDNQIIAEDILSSVDHSILDKLWVDYQKYLHLSTEEISFYYNCAKKYYDPDNNEFFPVPPIVIEVDYMTKGILSLNKNEFDSMTMKEFETMQLILSVKNEVKS